MKPLSLGLVVAITGCGASPASPPPDRATDPACEACIAEGRTWQQGTCTDDCAIQDISCHRDHCPLPCAADECGSCEREADCSAAGCSWHVEAEAMWCTP